MAEGNAGRRGNGAGGDALRRRLVATRARRRLPFPSHFLERSERRGAELSGGAWTRDTK